MSKRHLLFIALVWLLAAMPSGVASAQTAGPGTQPETWGIQEILERVQRMDPRLRVAAADRVAAHIATRRARWNRVAGRVRLHAGHQTTSTGRWATERMAEHTSDQAFAAASAELQLPLYAGGRISAAIDAADARLRSARHDEEALRLELAATALVAYAEALAAGEQTAVSERALSRARDLLEMTRKQRIAGINTEADVARAQLNLVRYEEDLVMQRGALLTALAGLRSVLLLDATTPLRIEGSLGRFAAATATQAPTHPEIARARAALEQARAERTIANADYLPSVELFAIGQYGNTLLGAPDAPAYIERWGPLSASGAAGIRAGWTVFDFFVTRDRVAIADAEVAARRARYDVAVVAIENRVREAIRREQAAAARLKVLQSGQQVAARALALARARYETGNATLTEVLDAELEAIRLENNRVLAGLQLALAHVDRMHAEGRRP